MIAQLIQMGNFLSRIIPEGAPAEFRELSHARDFQVKSRGRHSIRFQDLAYKIFPEFGSVIKDPLSKTGRYLFCHYPSPQDIVSVGPEELTRITR